VNDVWISGKVRKLGAWQRGDRPPGPPLPDLGVPLPSAADLRPLCPPVLDQGSIGSCVANALCEAMEFLERRVSSAKMFSRLYLYYWARVLNGCLPNVDAGLVIPFAVDVLNQRGVPYEESWPYDDPANRFRLRPPIEADVEAGKHRALLTFSCPNLFTIRASLSQGFPVVFGMDLPLSFGDAGSTGILTSLGEEGFGGGHSMLIIGYDDAKVCGKHTGALLVRNSWSERWGDQGNVWVPYDFVRKGIAADFATVRKAEL
jgi:C1A family cysteine protease